MVPGGKRRFQFAAARAVGVAQGMRLAGGISDIRKRTRHAVLRAWGYHFYYYCGKLLDDSTATLDHLQPSSRGGTSAKANMVPACSPCNEDKGALTLSEYRDMVRQRQPEWIALLALNQLAPVAQESAYAPHGDS